MDPTGSSADDSRSVMTTEAHNLDRHGPARLVVANQNPPYSSAAERSVPETDPFGDLHGVGAARTVVASAAAPADSPEIPAAARASAGDADRVADHFGRPGRNAT